MDKYDVIVIGGGLLGCFAARSLTRYNLNVALLERSSDLCTGISRANTAIVYSGCDTKPGTRKTDMCVRAAQNFPALCEGLSVRYSPCGSIMAAFGERANNVLQQKLDQGLQNGVRGIRLLSPREVLRLEPNLAPGVLSGLFVPDTGTVMPWELCFAAAENAAHNGAQIILNSEVTAISRTDGGFCVRTGGGQFVTRAIVNCAGMNSDKILEMIADPIVRIAPSAGDYFVLDTKAQGHINHVIFHEPEEKGKGITFVPTVDGNILIGPTERPYSGAPDEGWATSLDGLAQLRKLAAEIMPGLPMEHVIRSFGAFRPNPRYTSDDKSINDFCIIESAHEPFISLVGIKTPGLTCANELGLYVSDKIAAKLNAGPNPDFNPRRESPVRPNELSFESRVKLLRDNPDYARIICRCRGISEGEIIDAIRRGPPGAVTPDGIKRRVGAGSGRCQGSFCAQRVIEILARELECAPEDIITASGYDIRACAACSGTRLI